MKNTIKCVSLAIYYDIKNRHSDTILDIFDEKKQPLTVSEFKRELITRLGHAEKLIMIRNESWRGVWRLRRC